MSPRQKKSTPNTTGDHKLKIIGGRWRGRLLVFPALEGLRPTGSRVRETLFNWLMPALPGSRCLDLFAGSGALGFEALSRGAAQSTLIELNPIAVKQLLINREHLRCTAADIIQTSALAYLQVTPPLPFDIVFVDPPFAQDLWEPVLNLLGQTAWLRNGALIYLEMPVGKQLTLPTAWQLHRQKEAGQVCYCLYRYETNVSSTS